MDYEIEFHPVGDGTKAGDAITIRYGVAGQYEIMVVDGGTQDCAELVVEHIKAFYGDNAVISHLVSTHPDADHASGLREILRNFPVQNVWVHGLWHHAGEMLPYFEDGWTEATLSEEIKERYPIIAELIDLAFAQGASVFEPFQGTQIGPFTVLSPSRQTYLRLVPQFRKTPEPNKELLEAEHMWTGAKDQSVFRQLFEKAARAVTNWIGETWDVELLKDGATTAAENDSSTVLFANFGDTKVLLTGDAGVNALTWACNYADLNGIDRSNLGLIQVPHHGSRSNVGPTILDRLIGPRLPAGTATSRTAVVSCPKDDEKHPRNMVVNAFRRRGCFVGKTQGTYFRKYSTGMPARTNEVPAVGFDWFDQVEAYD